MSAILLDDIPDCAVLADGAGRVLAANGAAAARFGSQLVPGGFGPWFDQRHGWSFKDRADGSQLALFRPDADETARAKTMLFATLSHEIRTPLNGILGMAGLIAMSELKPAQRSWLEAVQDSGQHLLSLINDILDYAKLESGKIELEALDFDPVHTAQSIAELCSPRARERGLEIAVAVEQGVPARVRGDDGRLRQILLNLVSNAVKFTETGGVLIRIGAEPGTDRLRFAVEDTGIGIPAGKAAHIFEEFAQADSSHARRYGGTGLGLAIVRKLAAALGGEVGYAPRPGGGSCFATTVPLPPVAGSGEAGLAGASLAGRIVAVATGSDVLFEAIAANLAGEGAAVKRAGSPRAVRGACVLLLDHGLAEGAEASWVRTGRPLVALIPQERRDLIDTWRDSGAAGYLITPLRRASLVERVRLAAEAGAALADTGGLAGPGPATRDERAEARRPALGLRVLLAEDNPVNALLARALLQRSGCETVVVGTGEEALRALEAAPYDLVLMDVHMPVLDGYAATRALRAAGGRLAATPVVALTAAAMEEDRRACLAAGMDDFITKPLDPERLAGVLERWSAGRGADAAAADGAVAA